MERKKILLVEDESHVAQGIRDYLKPHGYEVLWASSGKEAWRFLFFPFLRLVILDLQLPDVHGFELAEKIRKRFPHIPLLFLSAYSELPMRLQGLELGAEDFLGKPFHPKELLLKIEHILVHHPLWAQVQVGVARVDFHKGTLKRGEELFRLNATELRLLEAFLERPFYTFQREELLALLSKDEKKAHPRSIDNLVVKLRRWVEPEPQKPRVIESVRGVGYRYCPMEEDA